MNFIVHLTEREMRYSGTIYEFADFPVEHFPHNGHCKWLAENQNLKSSHYRMHFGFAWLDVVLGVVNVEIGLSDLNYSRIDFLAGIF